MIENWKHILKQLFAALNIPLENRRKETEAAFITEEKSETIKELLEKSSRRPLLFPYQREIVNRFLDLPNKKGLLALPTGAGKTRTALAICLEGVFNKSLNKIVWLANTMELIDQAYESAKTLFEQHGGIDVLYLSKELGDVAADKNTPSIVFCTPQAVHAKAPQSSVFSKRADLVVFDEAHQAVADSYTKALDNLGCFDESDAVPLLGLSATPGRGDDEETRELVRLFDEKLLVAPSLGTDPVRKLEDEGILSKIEFKRIQPEENVSKEDVVRRLDLIYKLTKRLLSVNRKPLVFAPSVNAAIALAEAFQATGIKGEAIHSGLDMDFRRRCIRNFAEGEIEVLTNQRILATGYDCPAVTDVIFGSEVGAEIQFEQMVGRACRGPRTGGQIKSTVWEFDDHRRLHGLPESYRRYELFKWDKGV